MKRLVISCLLLLAMAISYGKEWVPVKLNGIGTIDFPATPVVKIIEGKEYTIYSDSTELCMAFNGSIPGATDAPADVYKGFITGLLNGSKGELVYQKNIEVAGLKGIEAAYTGGDKKHLSRARGILVNGTLYCFMFKNLGDKESEDADIFFNSLKPDTSILKSANKRYKEDITTTTPYRIGNMIGYAVGLMILPVAIIAIIIVVVRKTRKKRQPIQWE